MSKQRVFYDGQRFGLWTIVTAYPGHGDTRALCRCDCGQERLVPRGNLQAGFSSGCSNCRGGRGLRKMADGDRFGSWTVVNAYPGGPMALCRCDCGTERMVTRGHLQRGLTSRCVDCYKNWPSRMMGKNFGSRVVVEVDRDQQQAVLRCTKCNALSVVSTKYVRAKKNYSAKCHRCEVFCSAAAIAATGVSRQAISARVKNGWTREEAMTLQRGEVPQRLRELRGWKP